MGSELCTKSHGCGGDPVRTIQIASQKLGHVVSATAVRKLLRRNRIGPAPLRSRLSRKSFLRVQASAIVLTSSRVFLGNVY